MYILLAVNQSVVIVSLLVWILPYRLAWKKT